MAYAEQNRKWCLGQKWRAAKWEDLAYTFGEGALVRYVDNPPLADMEGIVEYLLSADGADDLTVSGKLVHGTYRTAAAWWEDVTVRGETRVRLYHECVPAASAAADTAYVAENNCTFLVTLTPYFRQASIAVPAAGSSGITYRVTQERRDPRTGLWMYVLEKREQVTTTTGVITIEDDAFKTVYQQAWYGVRAGNTASPGVTLTLWDPTEHAAVAPDEADAPQGTVIRNVFIQKNENCTTDIVQQKTVAKAVTGAKKTARQDVFEKVESVTNSGQAAAVDELAAAADGVLTERRSEKNADGTFDNTEEKTTEFTENTATDAPAQETLARDLGGTETVLEHAGQVSRAALPGSDTEGTLVEVVNRKTKAGRFWQTVRTKVAALWMNRVLKYRLDALEYVTEETHDGVTEETAASDFPAPAEVTEGAWTELEIETRPDKLKRIRKVTTAPTAPTTTVLDKSKTHSAYLTKERSRGYAQNSTSLAPNDPKAVGGTRGLIERIIMTLRRDKLWDYVKESDTERPVKAAVKREEVTPWGKRVTTIDRSQPTEATLSGLGTVQNSVTEGNLIDREKTVIELAAGASSGGIEMMEEKGGNFFGDTVRTEKVVAAKTTPAEDTGLITGNVLKEIVYRKAEDGVLRKSEKTVTPAAGATFRLLDKSVQIGGDCPLFGKYSEYLQIIMYMNVELSVPQAAVAAFVAAHPAFVVYKVGPLIVRWWTFFYQNDIGFALHVNEHGLWSGTLTMRATLTEGMQYTSVE